MGVKVGTRLASLKLMAVSDANLNTKGGQLVGGSRTAAF